MEFYKNAIEIRKQLTVWLLKDFGNKRNMRSVNHVIKDIQPEDKEIIENVFLKYGKNPNKGFLSEYPEWFVNQEKEAITNILRDMIQCITKANTIYVQSMNEYDMRRAYQTKAIGDCYVLYQELQYIISVFGTDLNRFIPLLDRIEKEVSLLKGWRQADNRNKPKQ